ncbi:Hypothetical predicted protein [Marmota monax]|uniref:Vomeronasal type-1 receptor n=1 Tax=Marmota monax TaxID=9995 RepID=A0A5E4D0Q8_MARMO|nr:hypothetical protein GHT09_005221 [Marmota monax]VTJ86789.1 Hypothetical predicted protein [Marmota monax]
MGKAHKLYSNIHIRNTVYTEIGIGVMANALLLLVHVSLHITRHRPKPTDLPIGLLALIHLSMLLIKGFIDSDIYTPQGESSHLFISIAATPNWTSDTFMHKRQSHNLHSTSLSPISSPELRATWTILLLLSCFVVMSILDSIISYARLTVKDDPIFYCLVEQATRLAPLPGGNPSPEPTMMVVLLCAMLTANRQASHQCTFVRCYSLDPEIFSMEVLVHMSQ